MTERDIGRILAKLESIHEDLNEIRQDSFHIEKRVLNLEKIASYGKGLAVGFVAVCGYVFKLLKASGVF